MELRGEGPSHGLSQVPLPRLGVLKDVFSTLTQYSVLFHPPPLPASSSCLLNYKMAGVFCLGSKTVPTSAPTHLTLVWHCAMEKNGT